MPFCRECGKEIAEGTQYCPSCGASQRYSNDRYDPSQVQPYHQQQSYQNQQRQPNPYDSGSFGWAVLGFFVPLVGLILWLVWMNEKPKSAKMAGIGALVSIIASVIFSIILVAVLIAMPEAATTPEWF